MAAATPQHKTPAAAKTAAPKAGWPLLGPMNHTPGHVGPTLGPDVAAAAAAGAVNFAAAALRADHAREFSSGSFRDPDY
jgi:hypothetical protein